MLHFKRLITYPHISSEILLYIITKIYVDDVLNRDNIVRHSKGPTPQTNHQQNYDEEPSILIQGNSIMVY